MKLAVFGATGGLGRAVVDDAAARGCDVIAHARRPELLNARGRRLQVVKGDVRDLKSVQGAVLGADAVISALGYKPGNTPEDYGVAMSNILAAMMSQGERRLVAVSGAGLSFEGDARSIGRAVIGVLIRLTVPNVVAAKEAEWAVLRDSDLDWTLVRPPRMVDQPGKGSVSVDLHRVSGRPVVAYADVARFMVDCATETATSSWLRAAPFVSGV